MNDCTPRLQIADRLGNRYQVVSILGFVNRAVLYLAEDLKLKQKRCMIRGSKRELPAENQVGVEEEKLLHLSHPYLQQVKDYYPEECGSSYLVLEYTKGESIAYGLEHRGQHWPMERVIKLALQLCEVLHYLHCEQSEPILLLSLQPSQLIMDEYDHVRINHYGLIPNRGAADSASTMLPGGRFFAAPEQAAGGSVSERTDLYLLGLVMYYLLSNGKRYAVERIALQEWNPDLPVELVQLIHKLLEPSPDRRYSNASEVKHALHVIASRLQQTQERSSKPLPYTEAAVSSVVIAVAGTARGVGSSHTSIMIAQELARKKHTVALFEANGTRDYEKIECVYEDVAYKTMDLDQFHIRGVDYIKSNAKLSMSELLSRGYDYIVLDVGELRSSSFYKDAMKAHIPIIVGSGSVWNLPDIIDFYHNQMKAGYSRWTLCIPFATRQAVCDMMQHIPDLRTVALPYQPDPFAGSEEVARVVSELVPIENRNATGSWLRRWLGKR